MAANAGALMLIKAGDGQTPENFLTVGGLRRTSMHVNQQILDATSVESGGWRQLRSACGLRSVRITGTGIFNNSQVEGKIRAAALSSQVGNYQLVFSNGDSLTGPFQILTYERGGSHDDAETFAVSMESAGQLVFTSH